MPEEVFDLTILGGGPAGLFAAYYAGFRGLKTKILDSLPELGGQVKALYPEKLIFDVAGFPKVVGHDLVKNLVAQAVQFHPAVCLNEKAERLRAGNEIVLSTDRGEHRSKALLIAGGIGLFSPRRIPDPKVEAYLDRGVHYFLGSLEVFRGHRILVVGGGDSAVDWALNLLPLAREVHLIHRRDQFRAHEGSVRELLASPARVHLFHELRRVEGADRVERAVVYQNKTQAETTLPVDDVVLCLGYVSNPGPIAAWGLTMEEDSIVVNTKMETNLPGVYAAGDITTYPGKVKLIAVGFGEACTAVNNAARFVNPKLSVFPGHSSNLVK